MEFNNNAVFTFGNGFGRNPSNSNSNMMDIVKFAGPVFGIGTEPPVPQTKPIYEIKNYYDTPEIKKMIRNDIETFKNDLDIDITDEIIGKYIDKINSYELDDIPYEDLDEEQKLDYESKEDYEDYYILVKYVAKISTINILWQKISDKFCEYIPHFLKHDFDNISESYNTFDYYIKAEYLRKRHDLLNIMENDKIMPIELSICNVYDKKGEIEIGFYNSSNFDFANLRDMGVKYITIMSSNETKRLLEEFEICLEKHQTYFKEHIAPDIIATIWHPKNVSLFSNLGIDVDYDAQNYDAQNS